MSVNYIIPSGAGYNTNVGRSFVKFANNYTKRNVEDEVQYYTIDNELARLNPERGCFGTGTGVLVGSSPVTIFDITGYSGPLDGVYISNSGAANVWIALNTDDNVSTSGNTYPLHAGGTIEFDTTITRIAAITNGGTAVVNVIGPYKEYTDTI